LSRTKKAAKPTKIAPLVSAGLEEAPKVRGGLVGMKAEVVVGEVDTRTG
jgi:hypothetical protein